jgi:hypothetical protein
VAASRAAEAGGAVPVLVSPVSGRAWRWPSAAGCPACPGGNALAVLSWLVGLQVGAVLASAGGGGSRAVPGAAVPFAAGGMAVRSWPRRQLCIHCSTCMPTIYRGTHCVLAEAF